MKSRVWIFLYVLLLLLLFFWEFQTREYPPQSSRLYTYEIQKNSRLDQLIQAYMQSSEADGGFNEQWGIVFKKVKKEPIELNTTKLTEVTLKDKTICIEQMCFKLLGIFYQNDSSYASFYNKNSKEKVHAFLEEEILNSSIKIKSIVQKNIFFEDVNSTRKWKMTLFDINSSKYKPKEFE